MNKTNVAVRIAAEHMHPEYRPILMLMMKRYDLSEDTLVLDVVKHFDGHELTPRQTIALTALVGANERSGIGKFSRKLEFRQHCEILGLHRLGYTNEILSVMYKIDRRTVTHIHNENSKHYKAVREEEKTLGPVVFIETYVTPSVIAAVESAKAEDVKEDNNKLANGKAGIHTVRNPMCKYDHRVVVQWVEGGTNNVQTSGWYYRDLDSEWPEGFFHCGPESMKTSQACLAFATEDISDKLS